QSPAPQRPTSASSSATTPSPSTGWIGPDSPSASSPPPRGIHLVVDELPRPAGEVGAVAPQVAPHRQRRRQRRIDHRRGEGLEGDRAGIAGARQCPEDGAEIDRAGAEIAAMALADVEIAELLATGLDGGSEVALLDVH